MAGEIKHAFDKVTDTIGGMAGKMGAGMTSSADGFVEQAAIGNRYEIEAARLAMQRSGSELVRLFAQRMLLDHTTAMHQMSAALEMTETADVSAPPPGLDTRRQTMIRHLADAPDDDFDATYVDQQLLAHEETVTLMRNYVREGGNPQLRSLAMGTLPVVERHLNHARAMKQQL